MCWTPDEPIIDNIETCKLYLERMSKIGMTLEIELGVCNSIGVSSKG